MELLNMASVPPTQPRPPLRRAAYIHISDLTTSAYNIDHQKLQAELARVRGGGGGGGGMQATKGSNPTLGESAEEQSVSSSLPQKRLQPPRGGYNLCVLVGNVNIVVDKFRVDRSRVRLAEVEVGDETGVVSLRARDDQIDLLQGVSERNGAVVLRNCTLELFQGKHIRLAITKWGKLSTYPDSVASTPPPPSKINRDRAYSLIDLSLVASEMVEPQETETTGYQNRDPPGTDRGSRQPNPRGQFQYVPQPQNQPYRGRRTGHHQQHRQHRTQQQPQQQPQQQQQPQRGGASMGHNPLAMPFGAAPMHGGQYSGLPPAFQPPTGGYREGMDMNLFAYSQRGTHHEGQTLQQSQMLLRQQYEMQQRQLLVYHAEQQQQAGRQPQLMQGAGLQGFPGSVLPGAGFDTQQGTGEPFGSAVSGSQRGMRQSFSSQLQQQHRPGFQPLSSTQDPGLGSEHGPFDPPLGGTESGYQGEDDSGRKMKPAWGPATGSDRDRSASFEEPSPGRMNPGAQVFAPSYAQQVQPAQQAGYMYPPYGHHVQQQQPRMYSTGAGYDYTQPGAYPPLPSAREPPPPSSDPKPGKDTKS